MASTDTKAAIASIATQVQSVGQARATLGVVTQVLADGYARLPSLTTTADVQASAKSLLDQNNAYAQKIYAVFNTDDPAVQDEDISVYNATRIAACMEMARSNVRLIEDIAAQDIWNLAQLFKDAIAAAIAIAKTAANAAVQIIKVPLTFGAAMLQGLWPYILLAGFGIVIFFWVRKRALKALVS
jgi:hypothetical protein